MRALTLWQPWAAAVAYCGKNIENRSWKPPQSLIGQRLAIHAGQKLDQRALLELRMRHVLPDDQLVHGAIVAVVTVAGVVTDFASPWFQGPFGWVLRDVVTLENPIPCGGSRGLWDLPAEVEAALVEAQPPR
jgi:hypothetical protein